MADSCGFYFYWGVVFVYLNFRPIPRLRNRSPARTVTRRVKARMATFSVTGAASGRACKSVV